MSKQKTYIFFLLCSISRFHQASEVHFGSGVLCHTATSEPLQLKSRHSFKGRCIKHYNLMSWSLWLIQLQCKCWFISLLSIKQLNFDQCKVPILSYLLPAFIIPLRPYLEKVIGCWRPDIFHIQPWARRASSECVFNIDTRVSPCAFSPSGS